MSCVEEGEILDGTKGYKYLGIIEDSTGRPTKETLAKIKAELTARAEKQVERQEPIQGAK